MDGAAKIKYCNIKLSVPYCNVILKRKICSK